MSTERFSEGITSAAFFLGQGQLFTHYKYKDINKYKVPYSTMLANNHNYKDNGKRDDTKVRALFYDQ